MKAVITLLLLICFFQTSCDYGREIELAPDYILDYDGPPKINLADGPNVVPPTVLAIFMVKDKYILAKSRRWDTGPAIIYYYIVKILPPPVEWDVDLVWSGLTQTEFDSITNQLGIKHFEWKSLE